MKNAYDALMRAAEICRKPCVWNAARGMLVPDWQIAYDEILALRDLLPQETIGEPEDHVDDSLEPAEPQGARAVELLREVMQDGVEYNASKYACVQMSHALRDDIREYLASLFEPAPQERAKVVKLVGPAEIAAIEYGFRCAEKGWNFDRTLDEALATLRAPSPEGNEESNG